MGPTGFGLDVRGPLFFEGALLGWQRDASRNGEIHLGGSPILRQQRRFDSTGSFLVQHLPISGMFFVPIARLPASRFYSFELWVTTPRPKKEKNRKEQATWLGARFGLGSEPKKWLKPLTFFSAGAKISPPQKKHKKNKNNKKHRSRGPGSRSGSDLLRRDHPRLETERRGRRAGVRGRAGLGVRGCGGAGGGGGSVFFFEGGGGVGRSGRGWGILGESLGGL